ncbi:MAG: hypothetical protein ACLTYN_13220 [Dysosmobacter welbionis]
MLAILAPAPILSCSWGPVPAVQADGVSGLRGGAPGLCKLIDGLGGAFGLILGMTGGCALLLLISVLASVGAVMP